MNCEGMPQIMKSRLVTTSVMALHAGTGTQPAEDIFRCVAHHRSSGASQEKRRVRWSGVILGSVRHILSQGAVESRAHGYQPCLVEFAFANREDAGGEIHIGHPERQRFTDAQARRVEQQDEHATGVGLQPGCSLQRELSQQAVASSNRCNSSCE